MKISDMVRLKLSILSAFLFLSVLETAPLQAASGKKMFVKVETLRPTPRKLNKYSSYIGDLAPDKRVKISSEVAGVVEKLAVYIGFKINKDQALLTLKKQSRLLNDSLRKSNYELALSELRREEKLFAKKLSTQAKMNVLKNRLEVNKALWKLSGLELKKSEIKSPLAGVVKDTFVEEGEFVKVGKTLLEILDIYTILVIVNIPAEEIVRLKEGQPAEVFPEAFPGKLWKGFIKFILPEADPLSRKFTVGIEINNHNLRLLPGMSARVKIKTLSLNNQMIIPRHAILEGEKGGFVYVVKNNKAVKIPVKTGFELGNEVRILSGLKFGDDLIVVGQQLVADRQAVEVVKAEKQSPQNGESAIKD